MKTPHSRPAARAALALLLLSSLPLSLQSQSGGSSGSGSGSGSSSGSSGSSSGGTGSATGGADSGSSRTPGQGGTATPPPSGPAPTTPPSGPATPPEQPTPRQPGDPVQPPPGTYPPAPRNPAQDGVDRARREAMPGARPGNTTQSGIDADGNPAAMTTPGTRADATDPIARLDIAGTSRDLQESTLATRDRPLRQTERSAIAGQTFVRRIQTESITVQGEARTKVDAAIRDSEAARLELDKSISRARSANAERWDSARKEVLDRYKDYAESLAATSQAALEAGVRLDVEPAATSPNPPSTL